jgi:hypothetical protein
LSVAIAEEPVFKSGRVVLSTGDLEVLEVNLTNKRIDVNMEDKWFIKRVLTLRSEFGTQVSVGTQEEIANAVKKKKSSGIVKMLRTVAEALSDREITLTVSYKGGTVVTIGAEARSTNLQLITKTRAVVVNNLYRLLKMII